jgi:YaiO family outer membrane protein
MTNTILRMLFLSSLLLSSGISTAQTNYKAKIDHCLEILETDSSSYQALFELSRAYAFSGKMSEAIDSYSRLLINYPDDADGLLGRGLVYGWSGEYVKALQDLHNVTENHPEYNDAWSALGDICTWSGDHNGALNAFNRCVQLTPENPDVYLARSKVFSLSRRFNLARNDLATAKKLGGDKDIIAKRLRELDRQPGGASLELTTLYDHQTFKEERSDWRSINISLKRELSKGSLSFQLFRAERFDLNDEAFIVDSYFDAWSRSYGNIRVQLANDAVILPSIDLTTEIYQGVGFGWELSGGYRLMRFESETVNIFALSISKYIGKWNVRERSVLVPKSGKVANSHSLFFKYFIDTVDNFFEFGVGREKEYVLNNRLNEVVSFQNDFILLNVQKYISPKIGISAYLNYRDDEQVGAQKGGAVSLIFRI